MNNNYVNFYWAGGCPPLDAINNLSNWSLHLRNTDFLPVLWLDERAYQEIQRLWARPSKEYLHRHLKKPSLTYFEKEFLPKDTQQFYWSLRTNTGMDEHKTKPIDITVVNLESFLRCHALESESESRRDLFLKCLEFYRFGNNLGQFANVKDIIIDTIVALTGGFYFDIDLSPNYKPNKSQSFFKSMFPVEQLLEPIANECRTDTNRPCIFPLLKTTRSPSGVVKHSRDVGFKCVIGKTSVLTKDTRINGLEGINLPDEHEIQLYQQQYEAYQQQQTEDPELYGHWFGKHRAKNSLATFEAIDEYRQFNADKVRYQFKLYRRLGKSGHHPMNSEYFKTLVNIYLKNFNVLCTHLLLDRPINFDIDHQPNTKQQGYIDIYLQQLHEKFEQVSFFEPTSLAMTGYQQLVKLDKTAHFLQRQWRAKMAGA